MVRPKGNIAICLLFLAPLGQVEVDVDEANGVYGLWVVLKFIVQANGKVDARFILWEEHAIV